MKIMTLLLSVLMSTISFGQDDAKAKSILESMSKKYQSYKGVSIEFNLTMENAQEDIKETSSGKAWVKGKMYKINIMGVETYFNGTTMWSYMKDAEEVNISTPDPKDENVLDPSKIFSSYSEGYRIRFIEDVFQNNRALQVIDLLPLPEKVKSTEFNRIRIKIDKDKNQIYQIIRYGRDGNDYTITLTKLTAENALSDSIFEFDKAKHAGVEIIDLRD